MPRGASFTEAQVKRAIRAAREIDPRLIVELTRDGIIRILPPAKSQAPQSEVDSWFDGQG
ncbi:hypothetical protein KY389_11355 [Paracoccus bogoriensis]|uniref:hypothetical protein n=1 Tax=Paracoccus bogoriensis TaxID=242065 RepID=UPI001CA49FC4|nr:hypothetical protein [Paracoccus bogoriensis]MBW7057281.1 hypothetical protein [Paracoccus bogoriensis]